MAVNSTFLDTSSKSKKKLFYYECEPEEFIARVQYWTEPIEVKDPTTGKTKNDKNIIKLSFGTANRYVITGESLGVAGAYANYKYNNDFITSRWGFHNRISIDKRPYEHEGRIFYYARGFKDRQIKPSSYMEKGYNIVQCVYGVESEDGLYRFTFDSLELDPNNKQSSLMYDLYYPWNRSGYVQNPDNVVFENDFEETIEFGTNDKIPILHKITTIVPRYITTMPGQGVILYRYAKYIGESIRIKNANRFDLSKILGGFDTGIGSLMIFTLDTESAGARFNYTGQYYFSARDASSSSGDENNLSDMEVNCCMGSGSKELCSEYGLTPSKTNQKCLTVMNNYCSIDKVSFKDELLTFDLRSLNKDKKAFERKCIKWCDIFPDEPQCSGEIISPESITAQEYSEAMATREEDTDPDQDQENYSHGITFWFVFVLLVLVFAAILLKFARIYMRDD